MLHSFSGADGASPYSGVIRDTDGNLYGTTAGGGAGGVGTVYKLDVNGNLTVLHSFSGPDGDTLTGNLLRDPDGNLYGTTIVGGANNAGTVFKLDALGNLTTLYSFAGSPDGAGATASLIRDAQGTFYSTTSSGGDFGDGTIFELTVDGVESVLYSFRGDPDAVEPLCPLAFDQQGNLYGTTETGGPLSLGTIFKLTPQGRESVSDSQQPRRQPLRRTNQRSIRQSIRHNGRRKTEFRHDLQGHTVGSYWGSRAGSIRRLQRCARRVYIRVLQRQRRTGACQAASALAQNGLVPSHVCAAQMASYQAIASAISYKPN